MSTSRFRIDSINSAVLSSDNDLLRDIPRPQSQRQPDFGKYYDRRTIFYDALRVDKSILLIGPRLLNIESSLTDFKLNGTLTLNARLQDDWQIQRSWLSLDSKNSNEKILSATLPHCGQPSTLSFYVDGSDKIETIISDDYADEFAGSNAIFTLQKNNDLLWIKDWAQFYVKNHDVNCVIIYDNGSDAYNLEDILQVLSEVEGIEKAVVSSWPFRYGIGCYRGSNYDSAPLQYAALEHARWRYLRKAHMMVNVDIDELVVSSSGESLSSILDKSDSGFIDFECKWIHPVSRSTFVGQRSFKDFVYSGPPGSWKVQKKWAVNPSLMQEWQQVCIHSVTGFGTVSTDSVSHRHFRAINTGWNYNDRGAVETPSAMHKVDEELVSALQKAFGPVEI